MSDTNVNPAVNSAAQPIQRRTRLRDAFATGLVSVTGSTCKALDSGAEIVSAVATRVKLHNISTAADILDEYGNDKVTAAQQLISNL